MQIKRFILLVIALTVSLAVSANDHGQSMHSGDKLKMPLSKKANMHAQDLPQRGETMQAVEKKYGKPKQKHSAKGQPPIKRWDYDNFSVYFETNTVIHSVDKRTKK